jgi:glyoxylase I family protein
VTGIEVKGLDHIVLRTERLEEVLAFYRDKLGLPVERTIVEFGLYQLRGGRSLIDIIDANIWKAEGGPGEALYDHFCLQIAGTDPAVLSGALDERGIEHGDPAERYGATGNGWSIYAKDPDGRTVEFKLVGAAAS